MTDWITVFTEDTWNQFCDMPEKICAYSEPRTGSFAKIEVGDRLLCYVSRRMVWAGILKVTGPRYRDEKRIYSGDIYPIRIPVEPVYLLDLDHAVPMESLEGQLTFFPKGGTGKSWAPYVRNSPRKFHTPDADAVIRAVEARSTPDLLA